MKRLIFLLILTSFWINLSAQSFSGTLKYSTTISYLNKRDSVRDFKRCQEFQKKYHIDSYHRMPYTQCFSINGDTLYAEKDYPCFKETYELLIQDNKRSYGYNYQTGQKSSRNPDKLRIMDRHFGPVSKNHEKILDFKTDYYEGETRELIVKIWIAQEDFKLGNGDFFNAIRFKNQLILKQQVFSKGSKRTSTTVLQNISREKPSSIASRIAALENRNDALHMYIELPENKVIAPTKIEVGAIAPNLHFRTVNDYDEKALYSYKGKGKYTLLEFWGTWCGPCLSATPKLKKFYNDNKEHVELISFNCKDKRSSHVKRMIEKKGMVWKHAFGTKKIIEILNPLNRFPTIVLLDDEMKVLLIGNPHSDLKKIKALIK